MNNFLIKSKASGWTVGTIIIRSFFLGIVIPDMIFEASGDSIDAISLGLFKKYVSTGFSSDL